MEEAAAGIPEIFMIVLNIYTDFFSAGNQVKHCMRIGTSSKPEGDSRDSYLTNLIEIGKLRGFPKDITLAMGAVGV